MKQFKSFLIEKRKNPEQNPKEGLIDYLKLHKDEVLDGHHFITFVYHPKLGLNPVNRYDTPTGVYSYPLSHFYSKITDDGGSFSKIPYQNKAPYIYLFEAVEKDGKRIITEENYNEANYKKDVALLKNYLAKNIDFSKLVSMNKSVINTAYEKSMFLERIKVKLNKELNNISFSLSSLIDTINGDEELEKPELDGNMSTDKYIDSAITLVNNKIASIEKSLSSLAPYEKGYGVYIKNKLEYYYAFLKRIMKLQQYLNDRNSKKDEKRVKLKNELNRIGLQIQNYNKKIVAAEKLTNTHKKNVTNGMIDNIDMASAKVDEMEILAEEPFKREIFKKEFYWSAKIWFLLFHLSDFISSVKHSLKTTIWNDLFYNVLNIGGIVDNGSKFIHVNEPIQAVFFSTNMMADKKIFRNVIYKTKEHKNNE